MPLDTCRGLAVKADSPQSDTRGLLDGGAGNCLNKKY